MFGGEPCDVGVVGDGDVDINEDWEVTGLGIHLVGLDRDSDCNCLVGVDACSRRF